MNRKKLKSKHLLSGAFVVGGVLLGYALWRKNEQARKSVPTIHYRTKLLGGYNAVTVPPFGIYMTIAQKDNRALLEHEMVHWEQYQQKGLLPFYFEYMKHHILLGYDKNPLEIEARANESAYCQLNYTECVRNGTAKTVQKSTFRQ